MISTEEVYKTADERRIRREKNASEKVVIKYITL